MKRLLTLLFAVLWLQLAAQTQSSLPSGSVPYGSVYLAPDGSVWAGATGKTFKKIGLRADVTRLDDSITNLRTSINGKVDKIPGKGLSTEDYTTAEKSKLAGIAAGAEVNVNADWSAVSGDAMILNKPTFVSTESDPVFLGQKGAVNGVATLNSSGKIPNAQIPALALVDTYVAASQAAMLALSSAEQGDVAIRTDLSKTFILTDNNYSTLASWKELLSPVIPAETDPIWGASPSAGITSTNIANWNTAYTYSQVGHLPLSGGTLTGPLNGTTSTMSGKMSWGTGSYSAGVSSLWNQSDNGTVLLPKSGTINDFTHLTAAGSILWQNPTGTNNAVFEGNITLSNGKVLSTLSTLGTVNTAVQSDNTAGYVGTFSNHPLILRVNSTEILKLNPTGVAANLSTNLTINSGTTTSILNIVSPGYWTWGIRGMSDRLAFYKDGTQLAYFDGLTNAATFLGLSGSGDRIVFTNSGGTLITATIGSGLSYSAGVLSATGGSSGTVTGTGTAGYISKWNSASDIGNSIISESSGSISVGGRLSVARNSSGTGYTEMQIEAYTSDGSAAGISFHRGGFSAVSLYHNAGVGLQLSSGSFAADSFIGAGTGLTGTASGLSIGGNAATWGGQSYTASQVITPDLMLMHETGGTWKYSDVSGVRNFLGLGSAAYTSSSAYYSSSNPSGYITNSTSSLVNYYTATQIQNFFSGASAITGYNYSNWNTAYGWGNHASAGYAPLNSPALTGTPTAPTPTAGDNSTKIATTEFIANATGRVLLRSTTTFSGTGLGSSQDFNTGIASGSLLLLTAGSSDAAGAGYYVAKNPGCGGLCDEWHIIFPNGAPIGTSNITFYYVVLQ